MTRNGSPLTVLYPEKRVYMVQQNPMTEAAIDRASRAIFTSHSAIRADTRGSCACSTSRSSLDLGGCLIMALGGALAASDRRYRIAQRRLADAVGG